MLKKKTNKKKRLLNRVAIMKTTAVKIISEDLPRVPIFYKHLHTKVGSENISLMQQMHVLAHLCQEKGCRA